VALPVRPSHTCAKGPACSSHRCRQIARARPRDRGIPRERACARPSRGRYRAHRRAFVVCGAAAAPAGRRACVRDQDWHAAAGSRRAADPGRSCARHPWDRTLATTRPCATRRCACSPARSSPLRRPPGGRRRCPPPAPHYRPNLPFDRRPCVLKPSRPTAWHARAPAGPAAASHERALRPKSVGDGAAPNALSPRDPGRSRRGRGACSAWASRSSPANSAQAIPGRRNSVLRAAR
jgi:hypothetical protein